jgi:hypothetical protein
MKMKAAATLIRRAGFGNRARNSSPPLWHSANGDPKSKSGPGGPLSFKIILRQAGCPGRARGSTRAGRLLLGLLGLLRLLRLFRLLRFLSHSKSSQGSMDGNATRGMLGGGPPSQHPRMQSQQIRRPLPHTVIPVSSRYPQLLCVLTRFFRVTRALWTNAIGRSKALALASGFTAVHSTAQLPRSETERSTAGTASSRFQNHSMDCGGAVRVR